MLNISLRRKAKQFSRLARTSVLHRRTGTPRAPVLVAPDELGITFIGHSAFFLQVAGLNVLVDPNYARWLFLLKRLRHPGLLLEDLPAIDAVLITHAHMDHLHKPSLRAISHGSRSLTGHAPVAIVPQGVGDLIVDLGFRHIHEMRWWEQQTLEGESGQVSITHVPARHWGARMLKDYHRGFGGYCLHEAENGYSLYHAGDTAYFDGFAEIGERMHPQIALMPIGAYSPESYRNVHTSPEDALRGFVEMGADWFIPMHFGTFRLSHEPVEEPLQRLRAEAGRRGIEDKLLVLEEGITQVFGDTNQRAIS